MRSLAASIAPAVPFSPRIPAADLLRLADPPDAAATAGAWRAGLGDPPLQLVYADSWTPSPGSGVESISKERAFHSFALLERYAHVLAVARTSRRTLDPLNSET